MREKKTIMRPVCIPEADERAVRFVIVMLCALGRSVCGAVCVAEEPWFRGLHNATCVLGALAWVGIAAAVGLWWMNKK